MGLVMRLRGMLGWCFLVDICFVPGWIFMCVYQNARSFSTHTPVKCVGSIGASLLPNLLPNLADIEQSLLFTESYYLFTKPMEGVSVMTFCLTLFVDHEYQKLVLSSVRKEKFGYKTCIYKIHVVH